MNALTVSIVGIVQTLGLFLIGALLMALSLGTVWALFWSGAAVVGVLRGTCRPAILWNAVAAGFVQVFLLVGMLWLMDVGRFRPLSLWAGAAWVPLLLIVRGARTLPDGRYAGSLKLAELRTMIHGMLHGPHH